MDFTTVKPKKVKTNTNTIKKIRIAFRKLKKSIYKHSLTLYIGKEIADQIGIKPGDKITFSYNPENNKIWLLKKSIDGSGFTLGKQHECIFILQLTWDLFEPEDENLLIREVKHDIYENGIRIFYN